jgi:hypothetical protein
MIIVLNLVPAVEQDDLVEPVQQKDLMAMNDKAQQVQQDVLVIPDVDPILHHDEQDDEQANAHIQADAYDFDLNEDLVSMVVDSFVNSSIDSELEVE